MKKLLAIVALGIAGGTIIIDPVFAAEREQTICRSEGVADAGYILNISNDLHTAQLSEETYRGPRPLGTLECRLLPVRRYPDAINNYLLCGGNPIFKQGSLVVRVYSGGIAGLHYAKVRRVEYHYGTKQEVDVQFGHLNCRQ